MIKEKFKFTVSVFRRHSLELVLRPQHDLHRDLKPQHSRTPDHSNETGRRLEFLKNPFSVFFQKKFNFYNK